MNRFAFPNLFLPPWTSTCCSLLQRNFLSISIPLDSRWPYRAGFRIPSLLPGIHCVFLIGCTCGELNIMQTSTAEARGGLETSPCWNSPRSVAAGWSAAHSGWESPVPTSQTCSVGWRSGDSGSYSSTLSLFSEIELIWAWYHSECSW